MCGCSKPSDVALPPQPAGNQRASETAAGDETDGDIEKASRALQNSQNSLEFGILTLCGLTGRKHAIGRLK